MKIAYFIILGMMLLIPTVVSAYTFTIDTSTVAFDASCGGVSCNNATGANDTSWSSYAWINCGGTPCSSTHFYENYTYDSRWNETYSGSNNSNITIIWYFNSTYGNTFLRLWNYSKSDWDICTWYAMTGTALNFTCRITPANRQWFLSGTNPIRINMDATVGLNSNSTLFESILQWQTTAPIITNCTSGNKFVTFYCKDEESDTSINCYFDATFTVNSTSTPFSLSGSNNYSFCFDPSDQSYLVTADINYWNSTNPERFYYLVNANLSNNNATINLYQQPSSSQVEFTIQNEAGLGVSGVIVKVLRYYLGTNSYKTVAEGKTDYQGKTYINLKSNEWYQYILEQNGVVKKTFSPTYLNDTEVVLPISSVSLSPFFSYWSSLAWSTDLNTTSHILSATVTDTSGLMNEVCLNVKKYELNNSVITSACANCTSSSGTVLTCDLGSQNATYKSTLVAKMYDSGLGVYTWYNLETKWFYVAGTTQARYGYAGLLVAVFISIALIFIGIWQPAVAIFLGMGSLAGGWVLGLFSTVQDFGTIFITMCVVGAILIYKMRV